MEIFEAIYNIPFLFQTLGFFTAFSMFVGSIVYNGDLKIASKGLLSIGVYALFVGLLQYFRVIGGELMQERCFTGLTVMAIVGLCHVLGMIIGILIHRYANKIK
jgi:hypothetical protein